MVQCPECATEHDWGFGVFKCPQCLTRVHNSADHGVRALDAPPRVQSFRTKLPLRVVRGCGHHTTLPYLTLCATCVGHLKGTPCDGCMERPVPLPYCPCQHVYHHWKGEVVETCRVCRNPMKPLEARMVRAGRWGFILKPTGEVDPITHEKLYERVRIPMTRQVPACLVCQETFFLMTCLAPADRPPFFEVEA